MNYQTENKIKDIEEFCKLYKINIPVESEFEYYVEILKHSNEYKHSLDKTIVLFSDLEKYVSENDFSSVRSYKNQCLDALKKYIVEHCKAYKSMLECKLPSKKLDTKNCINEINDGQYLISLDFKSANFNVLKTFDIPVNSELTTWEDLCNMFDIHPALSGSKSFRQIVFGNTNPKRLQIFQHENILNVMESLKETFGYKDDDFISISHDELILKVENPYRVHEISNIKDYLSISANGMPIRTTLFSLKKIKKNTFVKTIYDWSVERKDTLPKELLLKNSYDILHGVPGNKFYMYFKKYIINQDIDERDLMYYNDGELCKWVDEDKIINKKTLPHYEKPKFVLSEKDAKHGYSYLWNQMTLIIPSMSNEEKRRVVEIVAGSCKHCFQDTSDCQCWNDD